MKLVSAGLVVDKEGKILIARRSSTEPLSGWYEFPGGKLEKGETAPQSLVRELKEELDINSKIISHFADTIYKYETGKIKLFCYWVRTVFRILIQLYVSIKMKENESKSKQN